MNFPVFLNKWIIGFRPIKTVFWYWFLLINHDNWRMDDHHRYWDFWLNLNHGWDHMQYVHKFEEYWGKGSYPPEKIVLSAKNFDSLQKRLSEPPDPKVVERFRELMQKPAPWDDDYEQK